MKPFLVSVTLILLGLLVYVAGVFASDTVRARTLAENQRFDVTAYTEGGGWFLSDTNDDGKIDYALQVDDRLRKVMEAIDFNNDGLMDNFYFYRNEVLTREEIDTNHDGRIDLWVFLTGGVYIERYERDTNHDGVIDTIRRYD